MVSRSLPNAKWVRWLEKCSLCDWINVAALDGWAENAIKLSLNKRSQQAALAAETDPFAFVQGGDGADLSLEDILVQAFSAIQVATAAMHEIGTEQFHRRAKAIFSGSMAEIQRMIGIAVKNEIAACASVKRITCPMCGISTGPLPETHQCNGSRIITG